MEGGQVLVDAVDQPRVDGGRNIRPVQRGFERRRIFAGLRHPQHFLHFTVDRLAVRPAEGRQRVEEGRHHLLAIRAIGQRAQRRITRLVDLDRLAVGERHGRIRKIGVRENVEHARRRAGERTRIRENLFLGVAERVRRATDDVAQVEGIGFQARLGADEPFDGRLVRLEDLGLDVGGRRGELRGNLHHLLLHALVRRVARVLIGEHARVDVEPRQLLVERVLQVECLGEDGRRRGELAAILRQLRDVGDDLVLRRPPGGVGRINVAEIPLYCRRFWSGRAPALPR